MKRRGGIPLPVRAHAEEVEMLGSVLYARRGLIVAELERIKYRESWPGDKRSWQRKLKELNKQIRQFEEKYLPLA